MSKQIVVSGNRILAYGEDCFLSMGGTVICPETEKVYQNATIANVDVLPSDIDSVGYEYHAGEFVPCAPFGVGNGNVAVVCGEDCKSIKDSGISLGTIGKIYQLSYTGTGGGNVKFTFPHKPKVLIIGGKKDEIRGFCVLDVQSKMCLCGGYFYSESGLIPAVVPCQCYLINNTLKIDQLTNTYLININIQNVPYQVTAICSE